MDDLRRGAWITSTKKHLDRYQYGAEVAEFGATEIAGKAAHLLQLMEADEVEVVDPGALRAYCVAAQVRNTERDTVLGKLEEAGRAEVKRVAGKIESVEVYAFSREDVLRSAASIFDASDPTPYEVGSIEALERVCLLPRTESEVRQFLVESGLKDRDAATTTDLQRHLKLVGVDRHPAFPDPILFNEHAFLHAPTKIVAALAGLSQSDRSAVRDIQHLVETNGCLPMTALSTFSAHVVQMMEGLGLLDRQEVKSPYGNSEFVTLPQSFAAHSGKFGIGVDAFHHAKMLLCCLSYGIMKSSGGRGRIIAPIVLIDRLLAGTTSGRVRPSVRTTPCSSGRAW